MTKYRYDLGWVLSVLRMGAGAGAWVAPHTAMRILGVHHRGRTALPLVLRLFGARDFAMGLSYLRATPAQQDRLLLLGMGVDAADAAATALAYRRRELPARLALPFAATAIAAVGVAAVARRR